MDVEDALHEVEPMIRRVASRYGRPWLPAEDLAQELRMRAIRFYHRFDPNRSENLLSYLVTKIRYEAIDIMRNQLGRDGRHRDTRCMPPLSRFEIDGKLPRDLEASHPADTSVEYDDLFDVMMSESQDLQLMALRSSGMSLREIGQRYGHTEAWASTRLNSERMEHARKRAKQLIGAA